MTAGFRVYRTGFLMGLDLGAVSAAGYSFQVEMAWKSLLAGARPLEVPITFIEREHGRSKMTSSIVLEALLLVTQWGLSRLFRR
jgi:dolichol-phosphate mannosyltransferase